MYIAETRMAHARMRTQSELDGIIKWLATERYRPVMRTGIAAMLNAAGVSAVIESSECSDVFLQMFSEPPKRKLHRQPIIGDVFCYRDSFLALQPNGFSSLHAWEIRDHASSRHLPYFCKAVANAAGATIDGRRLRGMKFDWAAAQDLRLMAFYSRPYDSIFTRRPLTNLTTKKAELSDDAIGDAELLVDNECRHFLIRLARLGRERTADVRTNAEGGDIASLLERGLIRNEFVVLCRKDSDTLGTAETREQLVAKNGSTIVCATCGRPFSEEVIRVKYILLLTVRDSCLMVATG